MKWTKIGLIYTPDISLYWQVSHAALPTRLKLNGSNYRIFFSSRDLDNRAYVGYFDIDLDYPSVTLNHVCKPVLSPGDWGYFDDHGVQACSIACADNGDLYLYYLGWNTGKKESLFYTSIGLAISQDGGETFFKYSNSPILQRSPFDPWMVSGGTVIRQGCEWLMYYLSGFKFEFNDAGNTSWYDVKIARSKDGINWTRSGEVALPLKDGETNISRMTIHKHHDRYLAWFPVKKSGLGYQCGYAESLDGLTWTRNESNCLLASESGWDSKAIDKMEIIYHRGRFFMFYNGNSFGRDGIGLAYTDA